MSPRRRILLVDDEPHVIYVMRQKLEKEGFEVFEARNGLLGFDAARECTPDLIVTDYQMPECDGLVFAKRLRECPETCDIPILLLTARGYSIAPSALAETNILSISDKPFSPRKMFESIAELLHEHNAEPVRHETP